MQLHLPCILTSIKSSEASTPCCVTDLSSVNLPTKFKTCRIWRIFPWCYFSNLAWGIYLLSPPVSAPGVFDSVRLTRIIRAPFCILPCYVCIADSTCTNNSAGLYPPLLFPTVSRLARIIRRQRIQTSQTSQRDHRLMAAEKCSALVSEIDEKSLEWVHER